MAESAEVYKPMPIRTLLETMRTYMNDNRHSRDVNERWLCDHLIPVWETVCEVANRNPKQPRIDSITEFRAAELEEQINAKKKEASKLEDELKKLRVA